MAEIAPIYGRHGDAGHRESAAWAAFTAPRDQADFCASWLAILCSQVGAVELALLVLEADAPGAYAAAAVWPDGAREIDHLGAAAERALTSGRGFIELSPDARPVAQVGYPIEVDGRMHGAAVLELTLRPEAELQRALRLLHWASAWLVDPLRRARQQSLQAGLDRVSLAMDLAATALHERRFGEASIALVNELAARLECDRVSLGIDRGGSIEVQAISHTATFDPKTDRVRLIADAMDEALDLDSAVVHPPRDEREPAALAHRTLAGGDAAVCSVPLMSHGHPIGILTLQRPAGTGFSAADVELATTVGHLLGPILELQRSNARGFWRRLRDGIGDAARTMFGPGHAGAKLVALVLSLLLLLASLVSVPYRVAAKTVVEGSVRRAAVAPFDGYVAESRVRAGDTVRQGQLLARLEDKDLQLERIRWSAERDQADRLYRQALAARDRGAAAIAAARIEQADAQLALVDEKLTRASLRAPFDGVIVSGDLSQLLGAPVEVGKVLFEIAPLHAYRVIMDVDERDIARVEAGQSGALALAGMPGRTLPFEVKLVTPVATAAEGGNHFRVEARIEGDSARLRPGMEGVGKIHVGERSLIWIWTHGLVDWLRLATWKWLP